VLLVEDGSPDNAPAVCRHLADRDSRVILLQHADGANRGASESRNLGIRNARFGYVAFLDADDFYLPGRFDRARQIFESDIQAEAVYEAIGVHFDSDFARERWLERNAPLLTTVRAGTSEKYMFEEQSPVGKAGYCSLDGLTLRKRILEKIGLFDSKLMLHQDTAFFMKLAACAEVRLGQVDKPVTMRRVHSGNRITQKRTPEQIWQDCLLVWLSVLRWFKHDGKQYDSERRSGLIINKMVWQLSSFYPGPSPLRRCMTIIAREPRLLINRQFVLGATKKILGR
jgi:glycosyltransferase involved in cell wall biosynthesis